MKLTSQKNATDTFLFYVKWTHTIFHLYTHVYRLPQAVNWVSVGLDVAHAQSCHLMDIGDVSWLLKQTQMMDKLKITLKWQFNTHILYGSIEALHHHLHTERHLLGVLLKIQ